MSEAAGTAQPFWVVKSLDEMTPQEWESLCDGCGRCCLVKLEDEETGTIHETDVACRLFDAATCRCRDYADRQRQVPDCVRLTPESVRSLRWLPRTCAYRLLAEGEELRWWHPLVSGDRDTVHRAGISVQGEIAGLEDEFTLAELMERVGWEGEST